MKHFSIDYERKLLFHDGVVHMLATRTCKKAPASRTKEAKTTSAVATFAWLQNVSGKHRLRRPVSIIGPNDATDEQVNVAMLVGAIVARLGLAVLCGGRGGVMAGAARGAASVEGGYSIGILPGTDTSEANEYLSVVIPSGLGEARNFAIANGAACIIAIGDNEGTAIEVAIGLKAGICIFGLAGAAAHKNVVYLSNVEELEALMAQELVKQLLDGHASDNLVF